MIKATGTTSSGRKVFILGLSHGNLDRLRAEQPIQFDGTPYGYDGEIMLFAGRDELAMGALIQDANPEVVTHVEKGDQP